MHVKLKKKNLDWSLYVFFLTELNRLIHFTSTDYVLATLCPNYQGWSEICAADVSATIASTLRNPQRSWEWWGVETRTRLQSCRTFHSYTDHGCNVEQVFDKEGLNFLESIVSFFVYNGMKNALYYSFSPFPIFWIGVWKWMRSVYTGVLVD